MNKTLLVISTNRGLWPETLESVRALRNAGARLVQQEGSSDVSLARNHALSMAAIALELESGQSIDTILMVDDDIVFTTEDAQRLVDRCRETGGPCSGLYVQAGGQLAASRMPSHCRTRPGGPMRPMRPGTWQVGLGFLAFSAAQLVELAERSPSFTLRGARLREFTRSGAIDEDYVSEDYCLSRRLGGVELLTLEVGHLKMIPLYPSAGAAKQVCDAAAEGGEQ